MSAVSATWKGERVYVGELSRTLLSLSFDWVELEPAAMARVLELAGRDEMLFDVRLEAQT
jgi:hypothetical protein